MQTIKSINQIRARAIRLGLTPPLSICTQHSKKNLDIIKTSQIKEELKILNKHQIKELKILDKHQIKELKIIKKENYYE